MGRNLCARILKCIYCVEFLFWGIVIDSSSYHHLIALRRILSLSSCGFAILSK